MVVCRLQLRIAPPFLLPLVLHGHGWVSLPPHDYAGGDAPWSTPLSLGAQIASARVQQRGRLLVVELTSARALSRIATDMATAQLRHMLRLDEDLTPFWKLCRTKPHLQWVARRGGGRLLRSPTVFEDLLKLLFTTNCTWAGTTAMTTRLVQALGPRAPDGSRAFPDAATCAEPGERFFRDEVRAGYRACAAAELAARFADGDLTVAQFLDPELPTAELRRRLLALRGFGPYAAGQALRLLGRYDDLALDSWCRATLARQLGRRRPPTDGAIARRYREFGAFAGLALWCDLTAPWHGEGGQQGAADFW